MFQMMLNMWDLDVSLTAAQRTRAVATPGCPEALQLSKRCNRNDGTDWNKHCTFLCNFVRDAITPSVGLPLYLRRPLAQGRGR